VARPSARVRGGRGFDEQRYPKPSIETSSWGPAAKGRLRIRLDKELQGTHLKRWTLESMVPHRCRSARIPWARLISSEAAVRLIST